MKRTNCVVVLTHGKSDNGKAATLAFSFGLSGLTMGMDSAIFMTSDGAVWGYQGSAEGICVQGFPNLETLIGQYIDLGGRLLLCSTCYKTCSSGGPMAPTVVEPLETVEMAGIAAVVELAANGVCVTF